MDAMIPTKKNENEDNNHSDTQLMTKTTTTKKQYPFDFIGILNDSVFALREFSEIFDPLTPTTTNITNTTTNITNTTTSTIHMTSLSYSYSAPHHRKHGPQHYWVESVYRGLDQEGLERFRSYSCVPATHPRFCPGQDKRRRKVCIITNFEQQLITQFTPNVDVMGLYPTDAPRYLRKKGPSWIRNIRYWKELVKHQGFPIAKENVPSMIGPSTNDQPFWDNPLLSNCTRYLNRTEWMSLELNFSVVTLGL